MSLCQYRHSLGVPEQGVHAARLGPFAFWDVAMTVGGGYALARWQDWPVGQTIAATFVVGHVLHVVFCVDTAAVLMLS